ncbi:MAG: SurA N-terminal domain-containing protein [Massilia sp.]
MFEYIRTHKRFMQVVLALLILPFMVFGVNGLADKGNGGDGVAEVDGNKITQLEWDNAQRRQIDRYRQRMGAQFDQRMFDTPEAKRMALDSLIAEKALNAELARDKLSVSDAAFDKWILANGFAQPDGKFDAEQFKTVAASQGMNPKQFEQRLRHDMALQHLNGSLMQSAFAPRTVAGRLSDIQEQEREVQEQILPIADFVSQVKLTDEMVKAYYEKNAAMFAIPEHVKAEYVVLNPAAIESQVAVSDAEIADFYGKNTARFTTPEQRKSSHILITTKKDDPAPAQAAAKAKAEAVLADVRKNPADFAKIAKAQSQDPGSAEVGGDLGVLEKGAFVKPVEDAILGLKQGEISGLVQSEFGYHIITVTDIKPARTQTLDEVKPKILAELKQQKMGKKYSELAETFTNTVYEQSDSLKPVADKLKLKIETAEGLSRTPSPALGAAPFNSEKFLKALFSDDALKNKRNTEAVEAAPSTLIAGRVIEFKPAAKRPLAEVDAAIRQRLTAEEAVKLARKAGEAKLAAAKASGDAAGFGEVKTLSRTKQPTIAPAAARDVLKADVSKLPAYVGVELPGQGYGLYRIGKVSMPAAPDVARRKSEQQQIDQMLGEQGMVTYIELIKQKAKAKVLTAAAPVEAPAK